MEKLPEFVANHLLLVTLFIAILSLLLWNVLKAAMMGIREIDTAELTRLVNRDRAIVLDVRSADDYGKGHIINAVNMPTGEFEQQLKTLESKKDLPLVIYCARGIDSIKACRLSHQKGHTQVYSLKGGLHSWQTANLPLVKPR
ncbi:MAG: rhodanese-like domain-containing protein [Gammaproteobacteria bacterium]